MPLRRLLIAVGLLALLGGGIWWSNRVQTARQSRPSPDAPPEILKIPEADFQRIEIRRTGGEPLVLQKSDGGQWEMLSAPNWPVDQDTAGGLVTTLSALTAGRLVEEKPDELGQFGLAAPSMEVIIGLRDGKTRKLLVGDYSPAGGGSFAKLEDDARVFTIASYDRSGIDKTPRDLRDKRLLRFDEEKLTRVELTAKGGTVEFGKNAQGEWQIIRPQPLRADGAAVDELVRKLAGARMDSFATEEDDRKAASAFAGASVVGVARVTDAAGTQQIEVRRDKDKNSYARSSAVEGVHKVAGDIGDTLGKSLDEFRNKKLFDFGFSDPASVEIRDGDRRAAYQKQPEKWMSGDTQVDATAVNAAMDKLRELAAVKFASSGFTMPVFEAKVTWGGGKRSETVQFSRAGAGCFARREGEPSIYEIDPKALEEIQKAFSDIKTYQPSAAEAKKR